MRILVTGSRNWTDKRVLEMALERNGATVVIEGGARGADRLAREIAQERGWEVRTYPADWERYGRAAGPIRNQEMLDKEQIDLVIAAPLSDSKGTIDMIARALGAGLPVERISVTETFEL